MRTSKQEGRLELVRWRQAGRHLLQLAPLPLGEIETAKLMPGGQEPRVLLDDRAPLRLGLGDTPLAPVDLCQKVPGLVALPSDVAGCELSIRRHAEEVEQSFFGPGKVALLVQLINTHIFSDTSLIG
jgi:hypothetical protein